MTKRLKDLPVGAKIKDVDTRYDGREIVWIIVDKNHKGFPNNSVTLISEKVLNDNRFDAKTTSYEESEIRKWINDENGLLKNFSNEFKNSILETNVKLKDEKVVDKLFLTSWAEVGLERESSESGYKFPYFTNDDSRKATTFDNQSSTWWTRDWYSSSYVKCVAKSGSKTWDYLSGGTGVRPLGNINDDVKVKDNPKYGVYEIMWNQPPSKPSSFSLPGKAISRTETDISWTKSTDPEGDPISYKLERSLDGGAFVERCKGSFTRFKDVIEDKGHKAVVYRVTAIDSYGNQSESLTSASVPVSDNTIPVIETSSTNLGKRTTAYSVAYKVVDPDSGQTWTVTESLDGKVLKTFTAKVGTSYTSKLSASDWQKVLNGKHILKIEVVDSYGGKSAKEISFDKAITKLDFMLDKTGVQGIDKMPERVILSMGASIPSGASIKVEITNNALDDKPVWQDCTAQVLGNEKIFFSNKKKTATKWAVNVRVTGDKKTATDVLSVSIIGGFYD